MQVVDSIWKVLEPKVNALITRRLIGFTEALIERGQIQPCPNASDPEENPSSEVPSHCTEDCAV